MTKTPLFSRLFNRKPRLDHPRAEKRVEALHSLPSSEQSVFLTVAQNDDDLSVRSAALDKLTGIEHISQFLDDDDLGKRAVELVCDRIDTQHPLLGHADVRNRMLERLENGAQLAEIAKQQASSEDIAETIFCAQSTSVRQEAVALISNLDVLNHCERISRNKDKSVNRLIRDRLADIKQLTTKRDSTLSRAEQLIDSASRGNPTDKHYASLRSTQEANWDGILKELSDLNSQLHDFGVERLDLEMLRTRFPRRAKALEVDETDPHRFAEIISKLKSAEDQLEALEDAEQAWIEALRAQKAPMDLSNEFFELTSRIRSDQKHDVARDRLTERFEKLTSIELAIPDLKVRDNWPKLWQVRKQAKNHQQHVERFLEHRDFIALDGTTQAAWRSKLTEVASNCQNIVKQGDDQFESTLAGIDESLQTLDSKIKDGALQPAINSERQVRRFILRLPENARKRQFDLLTPLSAELKQLLNWKTFATQPKREELCQKIESLRDSPLEPQKQFDEVRALRSDWNALGPPSTRDEVDLQKRYDEAAEGAWEICAQWFEEQKEVRTENANRKEALARELENYIEDTNWEEVEWRSVQQLLTQHLKQFKDIGDADRSRSRAINRRFFKAYQSIRDRLIKHREETSKAKEELIERAREICEDETLDDRDRINSIKELQAEWKAVGPTFHKVEERLWSQFRELCNSVFENRRQQREERKETISQNIDEAKDMVAKLLRQARSAKSEFNASAVSEVETKLEEMVLPVRVKKELDRKLAQVDDILADRKLVSQQMEVSERYKLLLEKDAELAGYETNDSPIPVEWYDAVQNQMVWFESRTPMDDDAALRDIVLRAEIEANIEAATTDDEERRLQLRVGDLATTMGRSKESQTEVAERLIRDWVGVAHGEQPLRERFNRAMDVLLNLLGD